MESPLFSIAIICKNEANTLPKLFESLKDFRERGGEIMLLDTGSTDNTLEIASACKECFVITSTEFTKTITAQDARHINSKFVVLPDPDIVQSGARLFDFAAARNYISSLAKNEMICSLDADEAYTTFDIDKINSLIKEGFNQFEYQFVYAHKEDGGPAVKFIQSKFFNRQVMQWKGIVHEVLQPIDTAIPKTKYLDESIILLEHFQEPDKEHRGNYLVGLALDCFENPDKDRQSHYFARELFYTGRYLSAMQEFLRHIQMNAWPAERTQSMLFLGDCFGKTNQPELQALEYLQAFHADSDRREPLMRLAEFYYFNKKYSAAIAMATAATTIPINGYYANVTAHYEHAPHELMFYAKKDAGDITGAAEQARLVGIWQKQLATKLLAELWESQIKKTVEVPIPKTIFCFWFSESGHIPDNIRECIDTQSRYADKHGYTYKLITLENCFKEAPYVQQCITSTYHNKKWAKLADYLRLYYLYNEGGIYLDADVKMLPDRSFDQLLYKRMFLGIENINEAGIIIGTAVMGAQPQHPFIKELLTDMTRHFKGDDDKVWESGMGLLNTKGVDYQNTFELLAPEYFYPFNNTTKETNITANTVTLHYFNQSWVTKLPKVTILIPTLGREKSFIRLCASIKALNYPPDLLECITLPGADKTVPQKIAEGLKTATGDIICYAANDMEFTPDSLRIAVEETQRHGLVAFNSGPLLPDEGNICEHFVIRRDIIDKIGGEIFCTEMHHVGVDNLLWAQCTKIGEAHRSQGAIINHYHFSRPGGIMDEIYEKGWQQRDNDRKILARKLNELHSS